MDKKTRLKVYEKYGGHCAYCGEALELRDMQIDHIIPLCRGLEAYDKEKDSFKNYNPACRACNFRKGMLSIEDFRKVISNGLNVLNRNFTFRFLKKYGLIVEKKKEVKFFFLWFIKRYHWWKKWNKHWREIADKLKEKNL